MTRAKKRYRKKPTDCKIFDNYKKVTLQFLSGKGYLPLTAQELQERLAIPAKHSAIFENALLEMTKKREIYCKLQRYALSGEQVVIEGILRVHPRGFGFLQPSDSTAFSEDVFIPKHLTKNAVDGDLVEVLVDTSSISPKGPEGKVLSVTKRSRTHIAGTVCKVDGKKVEAYVPLIGTSRSIYVASSDEHALKEGDRLIMKVLDWGGSQDAPIHAEKTHYLGHIDDPSCDVAAAIEEYDLQGDFKSGVLKEATAFGAKVPLSEIKKRRDLRKMVSFTIDPDTAKDFDDALSIEEKKNGDFFLGVHIADVSHYVQAGSLLDQEAQLRCNSTYFPGFCLPMLPHELSSELCSLKAGVNRLTLSVLMHFDKHGNLLDKEIVRSVIKSAKRLTYKEAKKILDKEKRSAYASKLHLMVKLMKLLKLKRAERGSIEFALAETVVHCDKKGDPVKTERIEYDVTHQMVEEFMLKANEIVATHLSEQNLPLSFRVHEEPSEENIREFSAFARALGFQCPKNPTNCQLQELFDEAVNTPYGSQLAISYIRCMKLAYYSPHNVGHYGLSLQHYCHFTSPIRRYIDLVIHRILCGDAHEVGHLEQISQKCSDQERISAKAESAVVLLKKLRLLKKNHEKKTTAYQAVITRIKGSGILFEILDVMLEGFLHISEIGNDFFVYDEERQFLMGRYTGQKFLLGQKISLELEHLSLITLETKFRLAKEKTPSPRKSSKTRRLRR